MKMQPSQIIKSIADTIFQNNKKYKYYQHIYNT